MAIEGGDMSETGVPAELAGCQALAAGRALGPVWAMAAGPLGGEEPADLEAARRSAAAFLRRLAADGARTAAEAGILAAQAEMLDDPALRGAVDALLPTLGLADAVRAATERFAAALESLDEPYLAARAHDVREVADLWLARLATPDRATRGPDGPSVVVTARLAVGWLLAQPPGRVLAVVARHASRTMHATIVAAGLGIPVVTVSSDDDLAACARAKTVLVDGTMGRVQLEPPPAPERAAGGTGHVGVVRLGPEVLEVRANVTDAAETRAALEAGADGVGLFRTELAFARAGRVLSSPEQEALYEEAAVAAGGRPITFRTLDLGADKPLPGLTLPSEPNPQLGVRGVRLYRREPALFDDQLRALGRVASRHSGVRVMFPMVASPEDWLLCRSAAERAFDHEGAGPHHATLGVMLEIPSALLWLPELLAAGVGFVSLGTNDLLQYVLAQDREQAALAVPRVPVALLRLLDHSLSAARTAAVPVAMCGEAAADPLAAPLYALVGVREFSVPAPRVRSTKQALAALGRREDWAQRLRPVLASPSDEAAEAALMASAWWLDT
jgi:phosphoenolpyruvate-protein kinase (PTS system EI component)